MRIIVLFLALFLAACAAHPSLKELDCNSALGSCSASIEQEGYDWYVTTDTDCAVVTMETGEKLPVCDYKRLLGQGAEYGINSCQACVRRAQQ